MEKLLEVRVKGFAYDLVGYAVAGVLAFLTSPTFANVVSEHFGGTVFASIILAVVVGGVKHLRNLQVIKKLGTDEEVQLI